MTDLATLIGDLTLATPASQSRVRRLVTEQAARTLQPIGPDDQRRYTFAHGQLLEQARINLDLAHPAYRQRIHKWAQSWADAGWPLPAGEVGTTPRYLFDAYPSTLGDEPDRLEQLATDLTWLTAAVQTVGVDRLLGDITAVATVPEARSSVEVLRTQASALRPPRPIQNPAYVLRQLCLGALELGQDGLASAIRERLRNLPDPGPVPLWTTRRASPALIVEFLQYGSVEGLAVLPDGRLVSTGGGGRVQVWDSASPSSPVELGRCDGPLRGLAPMPFS